MGKMGNQWEARWWWCWFGMGVDIYCDISAARAAGLELLWDG